jgi:hypothetical protein
MGRCYMKNKKVASIFILVFFALLISSSHISAASDEELAVASLQSLPGIFVVVEDLSPELAESGVSEDQLKADVEEKLRGAGVKVLSLTEYLRTPGLPHFSFYISVVKGGSRSALSSRCEACGGGLLRMF